MGSPAHPLPNLAPSTDLSAQALPSGPTGLSYRYVQTLGQTGVGYFDDTAHLNYPFGLGLDASGNVWIGELRGDRAMKYDSTGRLSAADRDRWSGSRKLPGFANYHPLGNSGRGCGQWRQRLGRR